MKKSIGNAVSILFLSAIMPCHAATLTVTTTADSGSGSLRQAILDANADTSTSDVDIEFNIPGVGVQTMAPLSPLPAITRAVTIDGYTQPGASANTLANADDAVLLIELNGENLSGGLAMGLWIKANDCTVRGLVMNRFTAAEGNGAILVQECNNSLIEGNFFGTGPTGNTVVGNKAGVTISAGGGHRIGGLTPAARNIFGGNDLGIYVNSIATNEVFGNFVGIGADGVTTVSNIGGIYLNNCTHAQIGANTPAGRNVISGNNAGISLQSVGGNFIQGNFIGTDSSGTVPCGNWVGIAMSYSGTNLVGGTGAGEGNLISGNHGIGVVINNLPGTRNVVAGNLIGTDVTGTQVLGNGDYGILFQGASGNVIGGTNSNARNVIAGSGRGVAIYIPSDINNAILGNSIFGNTLLGIDLGAVVATPNDPGDSDDGANHLQNFPEITSIKLAGRNLKTEFKVDSAAANSDYPLTLEFFIADGGQGRTFIHRATYSTPQATDSIVFRPVVLPAVGDQIVATVTDAKGNTSEFSTPIAVTRQGH